MTIKPTHKPVKEYYKTLDSLFKQDIKHELAVRSAFQNLLSETAKKKKWTLIPELASKIGDKRVIPDGTLRDNYHMPRGYWEAKDPDDDLDKEIKQKIAKGYPTTNIIFEDTKTGVLYQNGSEIFRADLTNPKQLTDLLNAFFSYVEPNIDQFEKAVDEFKERVPDLALGLKKKIDEAHKSNKKFIDTFDNFFSLCKTSLNPNISISAVDEMLIQHLLTERLIRKVFDNADFVRRNVIAAEIEKVIDVITIKSFNRHAFLKSLDRFYIAIENAAQSLESFTEKQHFLNTVYERFFQGYSVKVADTHGIVYTPQPVVDFMCNSVEEVLEKEFGKKLGSKGVNILDPCTGTGNFIINLLNRIPKRDLPRVYKEQLFANEVMLMPYYIASLNIEHAYYEITKEYEPFEGICFVDTLDIAEGQQTEMSFMSEVNTARVEKQRKSPITVIIGNPPYNAGQLNDNDNNKNRKYPIVDDRIKQTYSKDSNATLKNKLYDPYVKFFRWATDRLGDNDGVVCFVSNNSFIDDIAFDGMRYNLANEFDIIYTIDLKGNIRKDSMRDGIPLGEKNTIFGLAAMVGISITLLVKIKEKEKKRSIKYFNVDFRATREEKFKFLENYENTYKVEWQNINPTHNNSWILVENLDSFYKLIPIGSKIGKTNKKNEPQNIFKLYSLGLKTNRDLVVNDFSKIILNERVIEFIENYNSEVDRYFRADNPSIDDFVNYEKIKWSEGLKSELKRGNYAEFSENKIKISTYRPYCKKYLYFDKILNDRRSILPNVYGNYGQLENTIICLSGIGSSKPFSSLITSIIPNYDLLEKTLNFPFYVYNEDGTNKRENITDWSLEEYQKHYKDNKIMKWDIFYYVYGILHHPGYREKYGGCLKKELPHIPYAKDFWAFSKAGKKLADLHLNYEKEKEYKLKWEENPDEPLSYIVEKMRLSKDKKTLKVNSSLTLSGIPEKVFEYKLGNRSALDWIIDQYRTKTDKRSGIESNPNNTDDPQYIVRLVGQIINVSLKTVDVVENLPKEFE